MDFEKELQNILENDPLGVLKPLPKAVSALTPDERLKQSFEEILVFCEKNGREPQRSSDIMERKLYSRLRGIRENQGKFDSLIPLDRCGLLVSKAELPTAEIDTIEDILNDDVLGVLDGIEDASDSVYALKNVRKPSESVDARSLRKRCKNFAKYEPIFKEFHNSLTLGTKRVVPFKSEKQIQKDSVFVVSGMLVFVEVVGEIGRKNHGNYDARLHCVFENGTESNMLLRSLAALIWSDKAGGEVVVATDREVFDGIGEVLDGDKPTGYVYVLRSLSEDPKLSSIENLYKIGFSKNAVSKRIANAEKEPTYLMAKVEVVTMFEIFNVKANGVESILHRFFGNACLDVEIIDSIGEKHSPREWFVAPLAAIESAVSLIVSGEIVHYTYDTKKKSIVPRGFE